MQLNRSDIEQYREAVEGLRLAAENHENRSFQHGLYGSLRDRASNTSPSNGPDRPPNNKSRPF